ncbi:hypothetical protein C3L33_04990, partial [Rhododendron williamsianum]
MGNSEETKPSKPEKTSSPPPDQANIHVYPDWAAMQAYYGPRVAAPPYFNSPVAPGHAPHPYMWGPTQPMMPPYGPPYAAFYAHGGVYAHPGVPLAAMPNMETPTKSSGNTDQGLLKKLKRFDGLAMSIGNGNSTDSAGGGANNSHSQSEETEGSSDRSNGNMAIARENGRKRSREETTIGGEDRKTETQDSPVAAVKVSGAPDKVMGVNVGATMALELPNANATEVWLQNERELKRERRKQSNRESARRSRLRRQEKLKDAQGGRTELVILTKMDDNRIPVNTENLLARVNNSGSIDRSEEGGDLMYESNKSNSGAKLRQLLDASPRADAVAAS